MRGVGTRRSSWRQSNNTVMQEVPDITPVNNMDYNNSMNYMSQPHLATEMKMTEELMPDIGMESNGTNDRKRPWERSGGEESSKIKKTKVPGAKNLKIRKYVQPKNAVMCLNELKPGLVYASEQEGVGTPFCISVEVDGQNYRGYGSTKQLAKQAAAEAALISFVKPPTAVDTVTQTASEDNTPWATLASFAIYKLFNEWREGRVGMCSPSAMPTGLQLMTHTLGLTAANVKCNADPAQTAAFTDAINAHLIGRSNPSNISTTGDIASKQDVDPQTPKPARSVPDNATMVHPVMVLNQMKPGMQYSINQTTTLDSKKFFHVSVDIDGQTFYGEGPTMKKAKFCLARDAIKVLYDVESLYEVPA